MDAVSVLIEEADKLYDENKIPELYEHLLPHKVSICMSESEVTLYAVKIISFV